LSQITQNSPQSQLGVQSKIGTFNDNFDFSKFESLLQNRMKSRKGRKVRPKSKIVIAILEACRTPSVEHWIMIKARLGYETFWSHMNRLLTEGKMTSISEHEATKGSRIRTYYSVTGEGLQYLEQLKASA
jgi:predicted transcriptional regulator